MSNPFRIGLWLVASICILGAGCAHQTPIIGVSSVLLKIETGVSDMSDVETILGAPGDGGRTKCDNGFESWSYGATSTSNHLMLYLVVVFDESGRVAGGLLITIDRPTRKRLVEVRDYAPFDSEKGTVRCLIDDSLRTVEMSIFLGFASESINRCHPKTNMNLCHAPTILAGGIPTDIIFVLPSGDQEILLGGAASGRISVPVETGLTTPVRIKKGRFIGPDSLFTGNVCRTWELLFDIGEPGDDVD